MRLAALLCLLLPAGPAFAGPLSPAVAEVAADAPAIEPPEEGLWAWIERLEGEVPTDDVLAAIEEQEETELAELAVMEGIGGVDVPAEYYQDPAKVLSTDPLFLDQVDPSEFDIPVVVNPSVEKWVRYFTGPGRKHYQRWLTRSTRYRPMMYAELEKAGLPADLVYLSMIESGYNTNAYSHAAAAGLWQFIPSTGRLYDLRVDWWVDDRRDPLLATQASGRFLGELHKMFDGNWYLAWASYNTGPGRVRRAVRNSGSTDYWVIQEGPYLHSETDNYVPKIIAAAIIGKHPERYGFTDIAYQSELTFDASMVEGSVDLEVLAGCAGISVDELRTLNPALRRWATPPEGYNLRVPKGSAEAFASKLKAVPRNQRLSFVQHEVNRGETLSTIASKYSVSVSDVQRANNLKNVNRIYVGMELVIPVPGTGGALPEGGVAPPAATEVAQTTKSAPSTHTVGKGDTLSGIASKHGVSVKELQGWNQLSGSTIFVGQKLTLHTSSGATSTSSKVTHVVARGETLSGIAARYGVSSADVQRWNGVSNASHIQVGQKLTVHTASAGWKTYTVKGGDSLGKIATAHGCSVSDIKSWNELSSSVIHPGQKLRLRG